MADLSFISLVTVAPVLAGDLADPGADIVVLVKPQFEAGRAEVVGKRIIRRPEVRRAALERVACAFASQRATIMGAMASPLLGPAGNAEFFVHARAQHEGTQGRQCPRTECPRTAPPREPDTLAAMLDAALDEAPDTRHVPEARVDAVSTIAFVVHPERPPPTRSPDRPRRGSKHAATAP